MKLPSWKTYTEVTNSEGQTGIVEMSVCAPTDVQAATSAVQDIVNDGYTPTTGRVQVDPNGTCQH